MEFTGCRVHPLRNGLTKTMQFMRLTAFFLLAACIQLSAKGYSQNVTLRATNGPLKKILKKIKAQTGLDFIYKLRTNKLAGNVISVAEQTSIEETVSNCQ